MVEEELNSINTNKIFNNKSTGISVGRIETKKDFNENIFDNSIEYIEQLETDRDLLSKGVVTTQ